jgi:hypothetical protein
MQAVCERDPAPEFRVMLPDAARPVSLPPVPAKSTFNHRTAALFVTAIGIVGCFLELAGPTTVVSRFVLFAGMLAAGVYYLGRVVRRARRRRRIPIEVFGRSGTA